MEIENSRKDEMPNAYPDLREFPDLCVLSGGHREKEFADSERQQMSTLRAYKRSPALSNSTWYKGILVSQMAGTADNNGAFDLVISKIRRGTEPPPHVHSREHEFFYLLSGEIKVFVDGKVFQVTAGECIFLPRRIPHAFLVTSDEIHIITLVTPGGFLEAINKMNAPAERMEVPTDADTVTYANADLTETIKVFERYGIRLLTPDEIRTEMPEYRVKGGIAMKSPHRTNGCNS